jgi:hypothetical protein
VLDKFIWEKTTPLITEIERFRRVFPEYNDLDDITLANRFDSNLLPDKPLNLDLLPDKPLNLDLLPDKPSLEEKARVKPYLGQYKGLSKRLAEGELRLFEAPYSESVWFFVVIITGGLLCLVLYFPIVALVVKSAKSIKENFRVFKRLFWSKIGY